MHLTCGLAAGAEGGDTSVGEPIGQRFAQNTAAVVVGADVENLHNRFPDGSVSRERTLSQTAIVSRRVCTRISTASSRCLLPAAPIP